MDLEQIRHYCLSLVGATESMPFDDNILVFKVGGKIFALMPTKDSDIRINLKCDPEYALELREAHVDIIPGYHMSKTHWNTVVVSPKINKTLLTQLINHSYGLVFQSLSKKLQHTLNIP